MDDRSAHKEQRRAFLRQLSWSSLGGMIGSGLLFCASIVAGRWLGPDQFGTAAFALLIAQIVVIYGVAGLDIGGARYLPRGASDDERTAILSTTLAWALPVLLLTSVVSLAASPLVAHVTSTRNSVVALGVALGAAITLRTLSDRLIGALRAFRYQAMCRVVEGTFVMVALFAVHTVSSDYWAYAAPLLAGASVAAILSFIRLGRHVSRRAVSGEVGVELRRYGRIALLHAITPIGFVYLDKVAIKSELGDTQLGLYTAYLAGTYLVVAQLMAIVTNVLFPVSARTDDRGSLVRRIRRLRRIGAAPLALALFATSTLALIGFGAEYDYDWKIAATAAIWTSILCFNGILTVVTVTHSARSYFLTAVFQGVRSIVFVIFLMVLLATSSMSLFVIFLGLIALEILDAINIDTVINRLVLIRPATATDATVDAVLDGI